MLTHFPMLPRFLDILSIWCSINILFLSSCVSWFFLLHKLVLLLVILQGVLGNCFHKSHFQDKDIEEWHEIHCEFFNVLEALIDKWLVQVQWGTKPFKWFLNLNYFLNNSKTTEPNKFKFGIVVEYYVINKLQFVLLHNLYLFLCY